MIKEEELLEAIAECQGQRNPNASTCMKLASYYIIQDHIGGKQEEPPMPQYSYASGPEEVTYDSGTEFSDRIKDMDINDVLAVMDELMVILQATNKPLHDAVLRKIEKL